ncbi:Transposase Tn5 dimerisation domain-containing protein, partial [Paraburkholderia hospita]
LMRLGRTCPDLDAQLLFERDEWRAAYILNKKKPPRTPPRMNEAVRLVAMLGGFLARKGDGEPGVKTIWQGLQRVMDFAAGLRYARELDE